MSAYLGLPPFAGPVGRVLSLAALVALAGCFDPPNEPLDTDDPTGDSGDPQTTTGVDSTGNDSIDPDTGSTSADDGETDTDDEDQVVAALDPQPDFVGLPTMLDGSASADEAGGAIEFEWAIVSAPKGSAITTDSLSSTTTETVDFIGDLGGDYEVSLTVTAEDGRMDTLMQTVTVPTYSIPMLLVAGNERSFSRVPSMVESDGTNFRAVACVVNEPADSSTQWLEAFHEIGIMAIGAYTAQTPEQQSALARYPGDVYEPPQAALELVNQTTDCDGIAPLQTDNGTMMPRYSADGSRIVSVELSSAGAGDGLAGQLVTLAADGSDRRRIRDYGTSQPAFAPAAWLDEDTVVWAEELDGTGEGNYTVYSAPDEQDGFDNLIERETLLQCSTKPGNHLSSALAIAPVPSGLLVIAIQSNDALLWHLSPQGDGTYDCSTESMLNTIIAPFPIQSTLELSPDRTEALIVEPIEGGIGFGSSVANLYRVPTDGSAEPTLVAGNDGLANTEPRWAANGRQLYWLSVEWEAVDEDADGTIDYHRPVSSSITLANSDGSGTPRVVHTETSGAGTIRTVSLGSAGLSINCNVAGNSGGAPWWLGLGLLGLAARRRRRRSA